MIPYMLVKLASNSSHLTRELVKYVPGRTYFRAVSSQNEVKLVTSPPPPIVERVGDAGSPVVLKVVRVTDATFSGFTMDHFFIRLFFPPTTIGK